MGEVSPGVVGETDMETVTGTGTNALRAVAAARDPGISFAYSGALVGQKLV